MLLDEDLPAFYEHFEIAEKHAPVKDRATLLVAKARMLLNAEEPEEALLVLNEARSKFSDELPMFYSLLTDVYTDLGLEDDLWDLVMTLIPEPGTETPGDIAIFIYWLNTMFELEQWSFKSKIQQRIRKLLKSVQNEEDKRLIIEALQFEHDGFFDVGRFREAEMFIDFLYYIDSKNPEVREQHKKTQELMRVEKEVNRIRQDDAIFSPIMFYAYMWLYKDYRDPEDLLFLRCGVPFLDSEAGEDLHVDEMFARGVITLRKKYPLIYRAFQNKWDEMFVERVQNLNREARRQLKL